MEQQSSTPHSTRPTAIADVAAWESFIDQHGTALLELYTEGCGICSSMEPVVANVAKAVDIPVATANARGDPQFIDRFTVTSVPMFVLVIDGEIAATRAEGFISGDDLTAWVGDHLE